MVYHEVFWEVAGAAAPIIALAEVVSLGEAYRVSVEQDAVYHELHLLRKKDSRLLYRADRIRGGAYGAAYVNMGLQFAVLWIALASIAAKHDQFSVTAVRIGVPIGLVLVLISTFLTRLSAGALQRASRESWRSSAGILAKMEGEHRVSLLERLDHEVRRVVDRVLPNRTQDGGKQP